MNKQLQDKDDEVGEIEDEMIRKEQSIKQMQEEYETKLYNHMECIRKLE